jgi:hypothetical protein
MAPALAAAALGSFLWCGLGKNPRKERARVDENGHYCFAVAFKVTTHSRPSAHRFSIS